MGIGAKLEQVKLRKSDDRCRAAYLDPNESSVNISLLHAGLVSCLSTSCLRVMWHVSLHTQSVNTLT